MVVNASGIMNAKKANNEAKMKAYRDVTVKESAAYALMKTNLKFTKDKDLLDFIKVEAIGQFNPKNLMVGIQDL